MILKPLRSKTSDRNQVSRIKSLPAPTKGWYVGENLAAPPEKTAYLLDNGFPQLDYVRARRGSQAWATGMPATLVESLMPFDNAATSRMFAACGTAIYDVSNTGAVGAAVVTGLTSAQFQFVQFTGLGGSYLVAVNGSDSVQRFDGTAWNRTYVFTGNTTSGSANVASVSSTAGLVAGQTVSGSGIPDATTILSVGTGTITLSANATATASGVTITAYQSAPITTGTSAIFSNVYTFKSRLYFVEKNSLNIWYLPVNAIGGAATLFPMQGIFRRGGYIVACGDWSIDSTSGIYNGFVVVSSQGEVVLYNGTDPGSWVLTGIYHISNPLGARCMMKAGGDLAIATEDGIVPMSKVQTLDQVALENVAITQPIAPAWRIAVDERMNLPGWQLTAWPRESMGIINLPKKDIGDRTQFIVNTRTGAWCRYTGWDANCFAVFGDLLFYGTSDGRVMQAEVGAADDGANYTWTVFPSFDGFDGQPTRKQALQVRPFIQSSFAFTPTVTVNVDFDTTVPPAPSSVAAPSTGALWDSAKWDQDEWPADLTPFAYWQTVTAYGQILSPIVQATFSTASTTPDVRLTQIDVLYEGGNIMG